MISRLGLGAGAMIAGFMLSGTAVFAVEMTSMVMAQFGPITCWKETYSAEMLAAQPERVVREMRFAIRHDTNVNGHADYYSFVMEADLVDGRRGRAEGPCMIGPGAVTCGVECDGGGFDIGTGTEGTIWVGFARSHFVRMSSTCANGGYGDFLLEPAKSENPLALRPMDQAACEASHLAVIYPEPEVD